MTFAASNNGTSRINFYDQNNTEGLYLTTTGESYGGTMTLGARWDDDEAKMAIKMYQVSAGGSYHIRMGVGNTSPKSVLDIEGVWGVGSKSYTVTTSYTTGLTINLSAHTGVYLKVTIHGDLSSNSAIGFMGEYFIQNGSGAYAEPGVIIREVNNTNSGSVIFSAQIVDPASSGTRNFEIQFKQDSATASVGATLVYQIQGTYNSIS